MSKSVRKYGFWALLAVVMVACKVERPGYVLSDGVMEKVLYDYHIAKAMGENLDYNEQYKRTLYLNAVFKKHNITKGGALRLWAMAMPSAAPVQPLA